MNLYQYQQQQSKDNVGEQTLMLKKKIEELQLIDLEERTGYKSEHIRGQRILTPPADLGLEEPPRGSEIYIGNIPLFWNESQLYDLFSKIGKIYEIRLMINFSTFHRGYAFLRYVSPDLAALAVKYFNHHDTGFSRKLDVRLSREDKILSISPIPENVGAQELSIKLKLTEIDGVKRVQLDERDGVRMALVEFTEHKAAASSRRKLLSLSNCLNWDQLIDVDWVFPGSRTSHHGKFHKGSKSIRGARAAAGLLGHVDHGRPGSGHFTGNHVNHIARGGHSAGNHVNHVSRGNGHAKRGGQNNRGGRGRAQVPTDAQLCFHLAKMKINQMK